MADTARNPARTTWVASVLSWFGRWLLLVPEAALLGALLAAYPALGGPPLIALLAPLLITVFVVRTLALHLARTTFEAGNYKHTSALIRVALLLYPWSADALALRGTLALARGEPEEAEQQLRKAIQLLPVQPAFYVALSSALIELGRPVEAIEAAEQAIAIDEDCSQAYLYLAEAERASGAASQTIEEHLRIGLAIAKQPDPQAALQCALAGHLIAEQRFAEASLALHGAESLLPRCPALRQAELRYHLGELFVAQGQVDRAREHFQGAEAVDPNGRFAAAAWRAAHLS